VTNNFLADLQLVYHVFNHRGTARVEGDVWTEPLLNRLLRFQAEVVSTEYVEASAGLLQASSEMHVPVQHIARQLLNSLSIFLEVIANSVIITKQPDKSLVSPVFDSANLSRSEH
jgi:hypothetical protein